MAKSIWSRSRPQASEPASSRSPPISAAGRTLSRAQRRNRSVEGPAMARSHWSPRSLIISRKPGAAGDPVTSQAVLRNLRFSSTGTDVSVADLSTAIAGTLRPERFQGTFAFTAPAASLRPLNFSLDPFAGTVTVADQPFQLDQTAVSFLQPRIRGRVGVNAGIEPLAYHAAVQLDPLELSLLPWQTEIRSLRAIVSSSTPVTFESTLHAALPSLPASFQFQQLSRLKLASEGSLKGMLPQVTLPQMTVPPIPEDFRVSGSPGGPVTITTPSGGLEIRKIETGLRKLVVNNGRLVEVALHAGADSLSTDVELAGARVSVSGSVTGAPGWLLQVNSQRAHIAAPDVNLQTLWPAAAPLLKRFGFALDGIRPAARLKNVDAVVTFSSGQLSSATAGLEIAAGPLGAVDLNPPLRTAAADAAQPVALHAELSPADAGSLALTATIRAPSTTARLESDHGSLRVTSAIDTDARGLLTRPKLLEHPSSFVWWTRSARFGRTCKPPPKLSESSSVIFHGTWKQPVSPPWLPSQRACPRTLNSRTWNWLRAARTSPDRAVSPSTWRHTVTL